MVTFRLLPGKRPQNELLSVASQPERRGTNEHQTLKAVAKFITTLLLITLAASFASEAAPKPVRVFILVEGAAGIIPTFNST